MIHYTCNLAVSILQSAVFILNSNVFNIREYVIRANSYRRITLHFSG